MAFSIHLSVFSTHSPSVTLESFQLNEFWSSLSDLYTNIMPASRRTNHIDSTFSTPHRFCHTRLLLGKAYTIWVSGLGARGLLHRYGFVCELADDTSADGLPDERFLQIGLQAWSWNFWEESPGQVFWASPLDTHCIFLPLSLLDPTSNFWISWLQVNTYPAQRLMACFWVLARRYRTQIPTLAFSNLMDSAQWSDVDQCDDRSSHFRT